jgi:PPM family protein phosphatase
MAPFRCAPAVATVHAFGLSQSGPIRPTNEDACCTDDNLGLFVVADGMGGHAAGEVASALAIEAVHNFIGRSGDTQDLSWPCGIDPALSFAGNRLRTAIYLANRRVFREAESHDDYMGMGTTVVCALITGSHVTIGHVGDSRLYLRSQGVLTVETRDDTWAQTILDDVNPDATVDASKGHPMQHVLTNVLGVREQVEIHVAERELKCGDQLLLCTDGVHNVLDLAAIDALLSDGGEPRAQAEAIIRAALDRKTHDNVTALIVHYDLSGEGHA